MIVAADTAVAPAQTTFGHPKGLAYLFGTEMWERFSFYGMQSLLMLYMVEHLLTPNAMTGVWGLTAFRTMLEGAFGPMTTIALAAQIAGMYAGFVYFTPVFGGLLGDRLLGQRRTVLLGGVLMAAGHALMAVEAAFLAALLLLVLGSGCLKGNISAQVGFLYPPGDHRRDAGFVLFNLGINIGVFVAPFVCGSLGELLGWHYGFGAAAAGMVIGLAIYVAGRAHLPPDRIAGQTARARLTREDWRKVGAILVVLAIGCCYGAAYYQVFGVMTLFIRDVVDRQLFGMTVPTTWFLSLGGLFIILLSPLMLRLWSAQAQRGREPGDLAKIGWGCLIGTCAFLILSAVTALTPNPGIGWIILFFGLATLGFLWYWPLTLAIVSKTAPASINSTMMGIAYLALFVANNIVGVVGQYYDKMSPAAYWLIPAGMSALGALLILVFGKPLGSVLGLRGGGAAGLPGRI